MAGHRWCYHRLISVNPPGYGRGPGAARAAVHLPWAMSWWPLGPRAGGAARRCGAKLESPHVVSYKSLVAGGGKGAKSESPYVVSYNSLVAGGEQGSRLESPYVVSYKWIDVGDGAVGGFDAYWPGFRRRLRGGDTKWNATGGVTTGLFP